MRPATKRLLALILSISLPLSSSAFAQSRPSVVLSPLEVAAGASARAALARALRDTGQVTVVEPSSVDVYLQSRMAPQSKKDAVKSAGSGALTQGIDAYRKLKLKDSSELLAKAERTFRKDLALEGSVEGLRAALFFQGLTSLGMKNREQAKDKFLQMLVIDPERETRELSEKLYPSDVRALFQQAQELMRSKEHGDLEITSQPPGAVVYLNGKAEGGAPVRIRNLPVGEHFVRAESDGHEIYFGPTQIAKGENRISIDLRSRHSGNARAYFQPVKESSEIGHERAAFLDEMGVALGADILIFLSALDGAVAGQFYDLRSQGVSAKEQDSTPEGLATRLLRHLDDSGYVLAPKAALPADAPSPRKKPSLALSSDSERTLAEQAQSPLSAPNQPGEGGAWLKNPWIWAAVGAGLLLAGGSVFLFTDLGKSSASTSTLTVALPGR